jgi:hypothetical protein
MMTLNHILLPLLFAGFPTWTPRSSPYASVHFLTAPPQVHAPSISSTISLPICEPLSISPTSYRNSPMGPPPFISFHDISASPGAFILHWGTRFCILYVFSPHVFFVQTLVSSSHLPTSSPLAACLPFGHMQPMSPLVGALLLIHPHWHRLYLQSTTQVTYPLSSEFTYLVPPLAQLTSDLVLSQRLRPRLVSCLLQPRAVSSHPTL